MTTRDIAIKGNPVLATRAVEVTDPATSKIHVLAKDMIATMRQAGAIGIAAPQVGESLRLIVVPPIASRGEANDVLKIPSRVLTILEGESLFNDASTLLICAI